VNRAESVRRARRAVTAAIVTTSTAVALASGAWAQDAPVTTTTLPEDNGCLGKIVRRPNCGAEPTSPGDRGGWQQLTLFVLVCAVIIGIAVYVWWRSRRLRDARRAEGHDPVSVARSHGGDVRRPPPPGISP
jgi:uncharacterized protein HemX